MRAYQKDIPLTDRQRSIIYGSLLGDGCIKGKSKKTRYLSISHSDKQKEYIFWLYEELKDICPSEPHPYFSKDNKYITYTLISKPRYDLFECRNKIYIPNKTINEWWLSFIDPMGISVWYMDDGSLNYKNKTRSYFSFATNSFTVGENYLLKKLLKDKYFIDSEVKQIRRNKRYQCNLVISDNSFNDFINLIKHNIPSFMEYKLPGKARDTFLKNNIESNITKEKLKDLYYKNRLTQEQIANIFGVHRLTICKYMNIFNINPRNRKEAQLNVSDFNTIRGKDGKFYSRNNTIEEIKMAERIFKKFRANGFPYPSLKKNNSYISIIDGLFNKNCLKIDGELRSFKYSQAGLKISSDFCPQIFNMASKGSLSPLEIFNDDKMLFDCICRIIKYTRKNNISSIRSGLKTYKNNRGVSNFPPLWCKSIINEIFSDGRDLKLLDFSCGFGGRLIGSYVSGKIEYYLGIDPLKDNIESNRKIYSLIREHCDLKHKTFIAEFLCGPAERILNKIDNVFDIVLTSPPYFNKEIYSKEKNQCYNQYSSYKEWRDQWFKKVLYDSYNLLTNNGAIIIFMGNYENIKSGDDCYNILHDISGSYPISYKFALPNIEYNRNKGIKRFDTAFVIKKVI